MGIKLVPIDKENYEECIKLKISDEQTNLVAPNIRSLVQAAYEPNLYPLGVYNENEMVGFILYDFDEELNGWSMSRLMIGHLYQNKGLGKLTLKTFLTFFKDKYPSKPLYTSAEIENHIAIKLYESEGFKKLEIFEYDYNGEKYEEIRMILYP